MILIWSTFDKFLPLILIFLNDLCWFFRSLEKKANEAVALISEYLLNRMKNSVAGVAESETTAPQPNMQFEKMANLTWGVYILFFYFEQFSKNR